MRPESIQKKEDDFFKDLTNSAGVKYKLTATTDIGNGVKIYSIRPNYNSYYYKTKTVKKSICLHFTVGYIKSDVTALSTKDNFVSVSYLVDRSGRIYEMFPDAEWSYHLGSGAIGGNGSMSKQSIGIEISNYGQLKLSGESLVDAYGSVYCNVSENQFYDKQNYRGYDYFASMTDVQIDAVSALIKYLGRTHDIPMNFKSDDALFANNAEAISFKGVFYHTNVRKDKFDWPFTPSLKAIIAKCSSSNPPQTEAKADATKVETTTPETPKTDPPKPQTPASENTSSAETPAAVKPAAKPAVKVVPRMAPAKKSKSLFEVIISLIIQLFVNKKH